MSDSDSSTISNQKPVENLPSAGAAAADPLVKKTSIAKRLRSYWWIPVSYCVPYMVTHAIPAHTAEQTMVRCHNMGLMGLIVAVLIYLLWRADCRYGAKQLLHLSNDIQAKALIHILGMALWVCWVGIGVVFCMAHDQVYELVPNLPGLQAPI
ncbi:MAG: hypothetical protein WC714_09855 [Candidatus Obscuribacterales bacterium]|jgi:hypothetical protein